MTSTTMADIRARLGAPPVPVKEVKQFHVEQPAGPGAPCLLGWSDHDLDLLRRWRVDEGLPTAIIAERLGRTDIAVRLKLHRKGWTTPHKKRGAPCR